MARRANQLSGTFEERCHAASAAKKEEAFKLPPGPERETLLADARRIEVASQLENWLISPGLRPPT